MPYNVTFPLTASRVMDGTSLSLARREGFTPEAIDVWGITYFPRRVSSSMHCAYCLVDIVGDVAASDRYRACSVCIKALAEGRMPARLRPDGTFQIGRAKLCQVVSDEQVEALLRDRDRSQLGREPLVDKSILGFGEANQRGVFDGNRGIEREGVDSGDFHEVGVAILHEGGVGHESKPDGAVFAGSQLDGAGSNVGRDLAGEIHHDSSSSVGGGAAQAALVGCASEPTEEAPSLSAGEDARIERVAAWRAAGGAV